MHRYYVHVMAALFSHNHLYDAYQIRHPFPPYATHYFSLYLLSRVFSYDTAEKIFVCALLVVFAYGFRFCARALGPSGDKVSLCIAPLFLHWALMMGFFNYSFAVGLFLFAAGFWVRATRGKRIEWVGFAVAVGLLTLTHPVPLLILICLCGIDTLLQFVAPAGHAERTLWQQNRWRLAALAFTCLAFLYPTRSVDKSQSASTLQGFGFHRPFVSTVALLTGISPYNTRATSLLINAYRLGLYVLLLGALIMGAQAMRAAWRRREYSLGQALFMAVIVLGLSLPFMPDYVNGSGYFATRLVIFLWIGALLAAASDKTEGGRVERLIPWFGLLLACISLAAAQVYVRPVASALAAIEKQDLPPAANGLILIGPDLDNHVRFTTQLAPDPFTWAAALPFARENDVILDSPWIEQKITPMEAAPNSPLLVTDIRLTHLSETDPPSAPGRSLPASREKQILRDARFVMYVATPEELAKGLSTQMDAEDAARFACSSHRWYLTCVAQ